MALEDAQRAMGLVRLHASEWHIDSHKIGVLGFSAGGHLVPAISNHFDKRMYSALDAADNESCRPDFAVAVYPGHLSRHAADWDASHYPKKFNLPKPVNGSINDPNLALNPIYTHPRPHHPLSCCKQKTITLTVFTIRWPITLRCKGWAFPQRCTCIQREAMRSDYARRRTPSRTGPNW
jgi:dienelactone hydrolase